MLLVDGKSNIAQLNRAIPRQFSSLAMAAVCRDVHSEGTLSPPLSPCQPRGLTFVTGGNACQRPLPSVSTGSRALYDLYDAYPVGGLVYLQPTP